jgi:hypothetical protein
MKDFKTQWQSGRHRLTTLSDNAKVADLMRHPPPGESAAGAAAVTIFGGPSTQNVPS